MKSYTTGQSRTVHKFIWHKTLKGKTVWLSYALVKQDQMPIYKGDIVSRFGEAAPTPQYKWINVEFV